MTDDAKQKLCADILESLRMVIDPELGENLVDLGLIYSIEIDGNAGARIEMTTTTKGCPAAGYLRDAVHSAVEAVPTVSHAEVALTYDPQWSPDLIHDTIRHKFAGSAWRKH
ncbi:MULTISPECIES: metal-sulfur cluster assembly factor [Mesorhizobium]|uniref:Metal-sulfur cluster assembly factor n=1 Tax=Mesorhizobium denitrificans TaxID=2294114 RepID=A0A371XKA1_9HYPH|nr:MULTISPECIES: metal-sulfur cluster assembly factor [Mesorhizobium]RFC69658.1 metal-sulfur cluster assembly factor [Mesorhizobium denitrificans]